jgi:uncharacterized protein
VNGTNLLSSAQVAVCLTLACSTSSRDPSTAKAPPTPRAATAAVTAPPKQTQGDAATRAQVVLTGTQGEHTVEVEVVSTPRAVERGLMFRQFLPVDGGMLFLMGEEDVQTFWMRNTLIPLDMIFIDKELNVVGVVENAEPRTDTPRSVGKPSSFVLEVNGGWSAKHGVGAGTKVRFVGVQAAAP